MPDSIEQIPNLRRVSDALGTSGQPNEAQLAAIAGEGFEAVINLALHDDARYSLKDEAGTVAALGMDYVHIPVQWARPTRENLLAFYAAMERHRNRRVWVHCAANMRVTAFLGLYWATRLGQDRTSAFALMDGLWKPNDVWAAFIEANLGDPPASA
jgi:protein tyrosine phosphatase (PTP) superfamily phosphohydrolase (DUF442 family)